MWRLCRYLGDAQYADDLAQETYERAIGSLHRYRAEGPARGWLLTIARRTCVDHTRRAARRRRLDDRVQRTVTTAGSLEAPDPHGQGRSRRPARCARRRPSQRVRADPGARVALRRGGRGTGMSHRHGAFAGVVCPGRSRRDDGTTDRRRRVPWDEVRNAIRPAGVTLIMAVGAAACGSDDGTAERLRRPPTSRRPRRTANSCHAAWDVQAVTARISRVAPARAGSGWPARRSRSSMAPRSLPTMRI